MSFISHIMLASMLWGLLLLHALIDTAVLVLQVVLGVAALAATWRVVRGPGRGP